MGAIATAFVGALILLAYVEACILLQYPSEPTVARTLVNAIVIPAMVAGLYYLSKILIALAVVLTS